MASAGVTPTKIGREHGDVVLNVLSPRSARLWMIPAECLSGGSHDPVLPYFDSHIERNAAMRTRPLRVTDRRSNEGVRPCADPFLILH